MTREDKELLLKDLCTRLPYGVVVQVSGDWFYDKEEAHDYKLSVQNDRKLARFVRDECEIKPYLRPMSSMTEEEWKEFEEIFGFPIGAGYNTVTKKLNVYNYVVIDKGYGVDIWLDDIANILNWLNAHHFDYRGLIEKGLALEAHEGMYKTE